MSTTLARPATLLALAAAALLALPACDDEGGAEAGPPATIDDGSGQAIDPRPLAVVTAIDFTAEDPVGVTPGFDLDGLVSDGSGPSGCGHEDFSAPDGTPGVDNQLAVVFPALEQAGGGAVTDLVAASIREGGLLMLLEVTPAGDGSDPAEVELTALRGAGTPLVGTDGFLVDGQTLGLHEDPLLGHTTARVEDGVLTAGPFRLRVPVIVFGELYLLELFDAQVRATMGPDGTLADGIIGGGVTAQQIIDIASTPGAGISDFFFPFVRDLADLAPGADGTCEQVSAAITFSAVRAYLYEDVPDVPLAGD